MDNGLFSSMSLFSELNSEELTETHQKQYVYHFKDAPGAVLEIGCGRGLCSACCKRPGYRRME